MENVMFYKAVFSFSFWCRGIWSKQSTKQKYNIYIVTPLLYIYIKVKNFMLPNMHANINNDNHINIKNTNNNYKHEYILCYLVISLKFLLIVT